jgi:hypothetical protein
MERLSPSRSAGKSCGLGGVRPQRRTSAACKWIVAVPARGERGTRWRGGEIDREDMHRERERHKRERELKSGGAV